MARDGLIQAANSFRIAFNSPEKDVWAIGVYRSCVYKTLQCPDRRTQDAIVVLAGASEGVYIMDFVGTSQCSTIADLFELPAEYNTP